MKKLTIAAVMVLTLMFSGSALAGGAAVYLGGGIAMPSGDWSNGWKMGFGGAGGVGFQLSPSMEVGARVAYTSFPFDDLGTGLVDGGEVTTMAFLGDLRFYFGGGTEQKFKPYATGTVGITQFKLNEATILGITTPEWTESPLTFGFGGGFDYMFGPTAGLWFDVKYMIMNTEGASTNYIPFGFGIKFLLGGTE